MEAVFASGPHQNRGWNDMNERGKALDRTLLLIRDHVGPAVSYRRLLDELSSVRVLLACDQSNASTRHGQVALITTALLCARMGLSTAIRSENVALLGEHTPLLGSHLLEALEEVGTDLLPGSSISVDDSCSDSDVCLLVGDTPASYASPSEMTVRLLGDSWCGGIAPVQETGPSWTSAHGPFGAMAAGALAAGEAYKAAMRRLRHASTISRSVYDDMFAPSTKARVQLAPPSTQYPTDLGDVDFISGGAITHAALYALSRFRNIRARARIVEPQAYDVSNLNRYAMMRRSDMGHAKASHLAQLSLEGIKVIPIAERYDEILHGTFGPLAPNVLLGADHIPSRWLVQQRCTGWLGVGATEHYTTVASFHGPSTPCAGCLHSSDGGVDPRAPTVAFVSFWAGLWLAALYVRKLGGAPVPMSQQAVFTTMLRPESRDAIWAVPVPRRADCPLRCSVAA